MRLEERNMNMVENKTTENSVAHVLYSRGRVFEEFNYFEALEKISEVNASY